MTDLELRRIFGENLRRIRNEKRMTQTELSAASGIFQPKISEYEKGGKIPTVIRAKALADALGCGIDDFMREEER